VAKNFKPKGRDESSFDYSKRYYEAFGYLPEDELGSDIINEVRETDWWKRLHPEPA
jgi:hypothetical protein